MGEKTDVVLGDNAERLRIFMKALLQDVHALEEMLASGQIESGIRRIGAEQELALVDASTWHPAPRSPAILDETDDSPSTPALGKFNIECNLDPLVFGGSCLTVMQQQLDAFLAQAREASAKHGTEIALTGILPTLHKSDLGLHNMTELPRYAALGEAMNRLRGGPFELRIMGTDELNLKHSTVMLEACNTSYQVHFQVGPEEFARLYNIAQAVTAPVLAAATNSPLLFGKRLWRETRIALFSQSLDTRQSSPHMREVSPRVSFGSDWVRESVLEIFREDIARFRVLLGLEELEDPFEDLAAGRAPALRALSLHNSTVYRWNRPCYGRLDGKPHLRIENRYLPSGPTTTDEIANAALWFGLLSAFASHPTDITERIEFDATRTNFLAAARGGLDATFDWFDGPVAARDLLLDELIPMAQAGLEQSDISGEDVDRYIGIMKARVETGRTGSQWVLRSFTGMKGKKGIDDRLGSLTASMVRQEREGRPVHEWDSAQVECAVAGRYSRVEEIMTTDLFTVNQDDLIDLVANLMDWQHIRHVPVEDNEHRLVGLVTHRSLLRVLGRGMLEGKNRTLPVSAIMLTDLLTVSPEDSTREAMNLMRRQRIACLPVVKDGKLVGIVAERDFLELAAQLLERELAED